MALPKIELPIYELKIPSTQKEIQVRPFKVKEEKLLKMAGKTIVLQCGKRKFAKVKF